MSLLPAFILLIINFINFTNGAREQQIDLALTNGILPQQQRHTLKLGDKIEFLCPEDSYFTLYKVNVSMGENCIVPAESNQIICTCNPGFKPKFILRNRNVGTMRRALFEEDEEGYLISVNSGLSESTKDTRLNDQYGGLCLTAKLRIPFKVLAKEGKESAVVKQQQTIEEFLLRQQQILKSREDGIPIREDDAKAPVKPVNFPQPSEVDAITEYQNIHPLSHSSESDKLKYISHKENGKFTNIAKESKVAKYLSDRVKLYLDVKSAITHDPHLAAKTRVIFQKVEKYFRGILNFNENEIRDIIDMFGLHNESDYDIGYEELTRDHTTASPTVIIVVLFCIFALLTVLTIILIMKHLR